MRGGGRSRRRTRETERRRENGGPEGNPTPNRRRRHRKARRRPFIIGSSLRHGVILAPVSCRSAVNRNRHRNSVAISRISRSIRSIERKASARACFLPRESHDRDHRRSSTRSSESRTRILARCIFFVSFYPETPPRVVSSHADSEDSSDSLDAVRACSVTDARVHPFESSVLFGAPFLCSPSARHATSASRDTRTAISRKRRSGFKGLARRGEERRRRSSSSAHRLSLIYITPAFRYFQPDFRHVTSIPDGSDVPRAISSSPRYPRSSRQAIARSSRTRFNERGLTSDKGPTSVR